MKKTLYTVIAFTALSLSLGSCVKDLDTLPLSDTEIVEDKVWATWENYPQVLAKVYAGLSVSGQEGPAGNPDILGIDEGFSTFTRGYFNCQELTTDEALICWNDQTIKDLHGLSWSSSDVFVSAMYNRVFYTVAVANEFLRQTTKERVDQRNMSAKWAEIQSMRAEARWLRAYVYWIGIDLFGNIPFIDETGDIGTTSDKAPKQKNREEVFNYIESELLSIVGETDGATELLPADGNKDYYGRATKGAGYAMLSRLYLNARVYTGQDRFADCIKATEKVIASTYTLDLVYANMFLADNHKSPEFIFAIPFDCEYAKTYGGTAYFINAATGGDMDTKYMGAGAWGGSRTTKEFVSLFANGDKRAMFFKKGQTEDIPTNDKFQEGIAVMKWRNVNSDGSPVLTSTGEASGQYVNNDLAIFRLAEMYLNYAEANVRSGGSAGNTGLALNYVNQLRQRAYGNTNGNISAGDLNLTYLWQERGRELYWECIRRTDLVRFNLLTTGDYIWQWKGGVVEGKSVASKFNIFPLAASDVAANPNLTQNAGY